MNHFLRRSACPACSATGARTLLSLRYDRPPLAGFLERYYRQDGSVAEWTVGGQYELEECADCGLLFQRWVGDDALNTELYGHWLSDGGEPEHDPTFLDQMAAPAVSRDGHELSTVAAVLRRPLTSLRVLDFGMGWGLWAIVARSLGAQSYGYDLAESRRAFAARRGVGIVTLREIPELGLDFVNTEQVLEHLAEPFETVALLASALRPRGILKISVPRAPGLARRVHAIDWAGPVTSDITAVHPLEHVNCFDRRSLAALASRAGLSPMSVPPPAYYAFARTTAAIPRAPSAFLKAFGRPLYHRFSRTNLYAWFRKGSE